MKQVSSAPFNFGLAVRWRVLTDLAFAVPFLLFVTKDKLKKENDLHSHIFDEVVALRLQKSTKRKCNAFFQQFNDNAIMSPASDDNLLAVGQNNPNMGHQILHFPTSFGVSERASSSKQTSE